MQRNFKKNRNIEVPLNTVQRNFKKNRNIEVPLNTVSLSDDDSLIIKVKDNNSRTYINTKTISARSIRSFVGKLRIESVDVSNPYSLNFYRNSNGAVLPDKISYKIYETIKDVNGSIEEKLVGRFSINSEIQNGNFKYFVQLEQLNNNRILIDWNSIELNQRYEKGHNILFDVVSRNFNTTLSKIISIDYTDRYSGTAFNKPLIKKALKDSIDDNLSIDEQSTGNAISLVNQDITESERFLKFGVITDTGDNLVVTNWVDGGTLNQVDAEIEPLGSIVAKMYNNAAPLDIKDTVIFTELYADDIEIEVDLSEDITGAGLRRLTPNFKKEVEENTISTYGDYRSFDELTLSGSSVQSRIIDHFLQQKQKSVGLNVDFTNFDNFVKFSSAEERLVNFRYKIKNLEDLRTQSSSLAASSASISFVKNKIDDINTEIRNIKNGFDEYELFLFNDSGSLYESEPYVSSSANIFASWPKSDNSELVTDGVFDTLNSWNASGSNTEVTNSMLRVSKNGEVSQSISLESDEEYVLQFDVVNNGLPVSFEYDDDVIVTERAFSSGSNKFTFSTNNVSGSEFKINGADYGSTFRFSEFDNISIKKKSTLLPSTDSTVQDWYNNLIAIAKNYDARNKDSLKNNTPAYIINDSQNKDYILFLSMIGQMFDEIWLYGRELGELYNWNNNISKGLSEDLSIVLLEAYGNNLDIGFSEKDVWEYILGVDKNGNDLGRELGFSFERRQKETIRRLLVNLPYFLKHKGTARSIKGLVLSYGIPLSTMFIREYGTFQTADGLDSIFNREKETKKLDMDGNKFISLNDSSLSGSNAIEFNFQLNEFANTNVSLVSGSNFNISVKGEGGVNGSILLSIDDGNFEVSSSAGELYNGEFWNILAQRVDSGSYEVRAYQFNRDDGSFDYELVGSGSAVSGSVIDSAWSDGSDIRFESFDGYLDEFRVWNTDISDDVFREHVKFPTSVKLEDPLKIPNSLLLRADIETDTSQYIAVGENRLPNLIFNPQYPTQVTASGFTVSDFETYTRIDYINSTNIGNEKLGNNKVRYNVSQSLSGNVLTPDFEGSKQTNENIGNVDDSYRLTVGFSPTDITNEIILRHFGGNDLLDEFGDPQNKYNDTYPELRNTVEEFFKNISINKSTQFFIEYIRNFDKTLFENIEKFVPERADLSTSIFIEPHYLDRSKAKRLGKSETKDLYNDANPIEETYTVSSNNNSETNSNNPLVITDEEILVAEVLSEVITDEAITVISQDEVMDYLNQSTDVIILQDGFESQILINNVWEADSSIKVTNRYGETFRFKVYKFDYMDELNDLESRIGKYLSENDVEYKDSDGNTKYQETKEYTDLTRLYDRYKKLHGMLFLLDYNANSVDNSELVTYEDLPQWLRNDLTLSSGTTSVNKTVNKKGIIYEVSDDTIDGGSVVEITKVTETRTIVSDPDEDLKLTVE